MTEQELIEQLADAEHASWSRWMSYLFEKCNKYEDEEGRKCLLIPTELEKHWQRQIDTPYAELSEREKQSDREEVAHILPIIASYTGNTVKEGSDLREQVFLALGEASMCWSEIPQGVFDSVRASEIGEQLLVAIEAYKSKIAVEPCLTTIRWTGSNGLEYQFQSSDKDELQAKTNELFKRYVNREISEFTVEY
jgi:hypothetical protein